MIMLCYLHAWVRRGGPDELYLRAYKYNPLKRTWADETGNGTDDGSWESAAGGTAFCQRRTIVTACSEETYLSQGGSQKDR